MAENHVWFSELKASVGSTLKPIWRPGCGITFTKDFGDLTRGIFELEVLNAYLNRVGPFVTRGENFESFYEALDHASKVDDVSTVAIRTEDDRVVAYVDLT